MVLDLALYVLLALMTEGEGTLLTALVHLQDIGPSVTLAPGARPRGERELLCQLTLPPVFNGKV